MIPEPIFTLPENSRRWQYHADRLLVSTGDNVSLVNLQTGKTRWQAPLDGYLDGVLWLPQLVIVWTWKTIQAFDLKTGLLRWSLEGHGFSDVRLTADRRALMVADANGLHVRAARSGLLQLRLVQESSRMQRVRFYSFGNTIYALGAGRGFAWELPRWKKIYSWLMDGYSASNHTFFSPDARWIVARHGYHVHIAYASYDYYVHELWDMNTGQKRWEFSDEHHGGDVGSVVFAPDAIIFGWTFGEISKHDLQTGEIIFKHKVGETGWLVRLLLAHNRLISSAGEICLLNLDTLQPYFTLPDSKNVYDLWADSQFLFGKAGFSDRERIMIWSLDSLEKVRTFEGMGEIKRTEFYPEYAMLLVENKNRALYRLTPSTNART